MAKVYNMGPDSNGVFTCVCCGMGSNRVDWIKKSKPQDAVQYVACDFHSNADIAAALKEVSA